MEPIQLEIPEYIIEVWDINNVFIADISKYVATSLRLDWTLNDIDEIGFSLDLVQFEQFCESIQARPLNIIEPYRTDIKIRRNGQYIIGAHVVETNVNFNSEEPNKLEVRCTGYLNHFKDRIITAYYDQMTYAEIARALVEDTQESFNHIKNGTFREGILGWTNVDAAYVIWDQTVGNTRVGSMFVNLSLGASSFGGARWTHPMQAGVEYTMTYSLRAQQTGGNTYITPAPAMSYGTTAITDTDWHQYTVTWTQPSNSSYVDIKCTANTDFYIDDVSMTDNIDNATRRSFGVTLGTDTASPVQQNDRVRDYDLQNIKDAIINLTKLENDNFDFAFDANKVFYTYDRKGSDKAHIELVYPQNITSMSTTRTAQTLHNKIYGVGAGIGDERLEQSVLDEDSGLIYRIREAIDLHNSVENANTLSENIFGTLTDNKDLYDNITVKVSNNELDLNNVEVGDAIYVRVDGSTYVDYINNLYRIMEMSVDISLNAEESVTLVLKKWSV